MPTESIKSTLTMVSGILLLSTLGVFASTQQEISRGVLFISSRNQVPEVYVMDSDGSRQRRLTTIQINPSNENVGRLGCSSPAWNPAGTQIAFYARMTIAPESGGLYIMDGSGTNIKQLTSGYYDSEIAWSPDGVKIAFGRSTEISRDIFVINRDGSDLTRLTELAGDDDDPTWTRDGSSIIYVSMRNRPPEIYIMNVDGSNQRKLLNSDYDEGAYDYSPSVSPTNTHIAFMTQRDALPKIALMNVSGRDIHYLKTADDRFIVGSSPSWSPDGMTIVFHSTEQKMNGMGSEKNDIFCFRFTDKSVTQLTRHAADDRYPNWY